MTFFHHFSISCNYISVCFEPRVTSKLARVKVGWCQIRRGTILRTYQILYKTSSGILHFFGVWIQNLSILTLSRKYTTYKPCRNGVTLFSLFFCLLLYNISLLRMHGRIYGAKELYILWKFPLCVEKETTFFPEKTLNAFFLFCSRLI